ncbi:hypothetical protein PVAND_003632 [Polypedilum vanderplanki]|uniref:Uncharacterized protein n=1 Tax=Polypedilum vanderplanki TaxID=319348 RepID=A0A9J6BV65_POLVA|nr:hypothetical protein PVAND_003632 [Polypedilum vanderplanki]
MLTPSYLKVNHFVNALRQFDTHEQITSTSAIFQTLNYNKIIPVFVLDYNINTFDPIILLEDLKAAANLKIKECVWELGKSSIDLTDEKSMNKYIDDLKTLKILCESVKRDRKLEWNVAAVLTENINNRIKFNVEGFDFGKISISDVSSKSPIKKEKDQKVWATFSKTSDVIENEKVKRMSKGCDENCLIDGLNLAKFLGEASKKGYDVVYFDSYHDDFKLIINKMHNALIGTKVFNVLGKKSTQSNVYAHCSKKMNGGVTLVGINFANTRAKVNVKLLSGEIKSNSIISQYLLSVADGQVLLNNERFNGTILPAYKFKKISKKVVDFYIPPFSITFWLIKNANIKECIKDESIVSTKSSELLSSSDDLLRQLASMRMKRQINFPKFDLKAFNFKTTGLQNLMPSKLNQRSISDVLLNANTEIYKVAPVEINPLQSSENPSLPKGDVYLLVNDGMKDDYVDAEIQYPIQKSKKTEYSRKKAKTNQYDMQKQQSEAPEFFISHDYVEKPNEKLTRKSTTKRTSQPSEKEVGELFEIELPHINDAPNDQLSANSNHQNIEIKTVMRELEPTHRQSKKALLAAKRKFDQNQLMDLLKDAKLQEVDKTKFTNADEYEIIDLTQADDEYEEYDDNEDGFFDNNNYKVRTRRAAAFDYHQNEIPRYGEHIYDRSSEEFEKEDDEDLFAGVRVYITPRHEIQSSTIKNELETLQPVVINENSSVGVKVVDAFSKSLDDVIYTIHKNIISWWYLFSS